MPDIGQECLMSQANSSLAGVDIITALRANEDHLRGCQGREYACDCGYDDRQDGLRLLAAAEIERLRAALQAARQSIMGHVIDCGDHCEDAVIAIDRALANEK
jgi:hypothetical protein